MKLFQGSWNISLEPQIFMRKMKVWEVSLVMLLLTSGSKDWRCNSAKIDGFCCRNVPGLSPCHSSWKEGETSKHLWVVKNEGGGHTISLLIHEGWPGSACDKTQVINILWNRLKLGPLAAPLSLWLIRGTYFTFSNRYRDVGEADQPYRAEQIWIYDCDMQTRFSGPGGTVGPLSGSIFSIFLTLLLLFFQDSLFHLK